MLMDYIEQNSIDPQVILSKFSSYHEFLKKYKYTQMELSDDATKIYVSYQEKYHLIKKFGLFST